MTDENPKNLARSFKLIRFFCQKELVEELEGNLIEYHQELKASENRFVFLKYWYQVIAYLRPSTFKKLTNSKFNNMFYFNPILTFRNLYRYKATSLLNIICFSLGLIATIFLYFYVSNELSADSFHEDKNRIYRVKRMAEVNGEIYNIAVTAGPYAKALKNDFPETIESTMRVVLTDGLVGHGEKKFIENRLAFVDKNFFSFFSFPLVSGDENTVLKNGKEVVISKKAAKKYFGDESPLGKILDYGNEAKFIVSGVFDEFPNTSQMEFDLVFPLTHYETYDWYNSWTSNGTITYVKFPENVSVSNFTTQLPDFTEKHLGDFYREIGRKLDLGLEPMTDIYFNNTTKYDSLKHGDKQSIILLILVALAILFIACFNYVNLAISHSFVRAKEVSIRKVLGVNKKRLIFQFLGESLLILFISILLSIVISILILPYLNSLFDLQVSYNWLDMNVIIFFLGLIVTIMVTSGLYPALLMSSFEPVKILKGNKSSFGKKPILRKGLVITQFVISSFMIVSTIFIAVQTNYLNNKKLGFQQEAIVIMQLNNDEIFQKRESFQNKLNSSTSIVETSLTSGEPGGFHDTYLIKVKGQEGDIVVKTAFTDNSYIKLFGIELASGRNFSNDIISDEKSTIILNEMAVKETGYSTEEIVGKKMIIPGYNDNRDYTVIGVTKDFHFNTLKSAIEPLAIINADDPRRIAVRLDPQNIKAGLQDLNKIYEEFCPDFPISYNFLDDNLANLYVNEKKQARIFIVFSGISILLACLGIFGLAAYSTQQRQKELGIRKILGATPSQVIGLISKEFLISVGIAIAIAAPAVWYFVSNWLESFAYRISIESYWYVFLLGGLATLLVSLLTVILKTYSSAISSPTESLKIE